MGCAIAPRIPTTPPSAAKNRRLEHGALFSASVRNRSKCNRPKGHEYHEYLFGLGEVTQLGRTYSPVRHPNSLYLSNFSLPNKESVQMDYCCLLLQLT